MIKYKAGAKYVLITFASKTESVKMEKKEEKRIDGVFSFFNATAAAICTQKLHCIAEFWGKTIFV